MNCDDFIMIVTKHYSFLGGLLCATATVGFLLQSIHVKCPVAITSHVYVDLRLPNTQVLLLDGSSFRLCPYDLLTAQVFARG